MLDTVTKERDEFKDQLDTALAVQVCVNVAVDAYIHICLYIDI